MALESPMPSPRSLGPWKERGGDPKLTRYESLVDKSSTTKPEVKVCKKKKKTSHEWVWKAGLLILYIVLGRSLRDQSLLM